MHTFCIPGRAIVPTHAPRGLIPGLRNPGRYHRRAACAPLLHGVDTHMCTVANVLCTDLAGGQLHAPGGGGQHAHTFSIPGLRNLHRYWR